MVQQLLLDDFTEAQLAQATPAVLMQLVQDVLARLSSALSLQSQRSRAWLP